MPVAFMKALGAALVALGVSGVASGVYAHSLLGVGINAHLSAIHLLAGSGAILASLVSSRLAREVCLICGVTFALVALSGFFIVEPVVRWLNLNSMDNYLHLAIAAACLFVGLASLQSPAEIRQRPRIRFEPPERAAVPRRSWKVGFHG